MSDELRINLGLILGYPRLLYRHFLGNIPSNVVNLSREGEKNKELRIFSLFSQFDQIAVLLVFACMPSLS